jgi:peptidoglycan/LPS O-acetylase OafA/YrhL
MASGSESRIPSLDGIRGLAAMTVFVSHVGLRDIIPGGFGVTVFFFLSGFLITTLLRKEWDKSGDISLKHFYLRRAFRIWPPMYIVLLILMIPAVGGTERLEATPGAIAAQFLQYTNYYIIYASDGSLIPGACPMWSLAVEEHFYLVFPLGLLFLLRRHDPFTTGRILLGLCGVVLLWRCVLVIGFGFGEEYTFLATDTRLDSMLYGCVLALMANPTMTGGRDLVRERTLAWLVACAFAVLAFCFVYRDPVFRETARYTLQGLALAPLFYAAVRCNHWLIFRWLDAPIMRGMGLISYTFYLIHITVLAAVERIWDGPWIMHAVVGFVGSVAFAVLMYVLVESRMARLRHRMRAS